MSELPRMTAFFTKDGYVFLERQTYAKARSKDKSSFNQAADIMLAGAKAELRMRRGGKGRGFYLHSTSWSEVRHRMLELYTVDSKFVDTVEYEFDVFDEIANEWPE